MSADVTVAVALLTFKLRPAVRAESTAGSQTLSRSDKPLANQWIITPRTNPRASVRLILVPDAGGSPSTFRGWGERLASADVGLVQLPGRGNLLHEPPLQSIHEVAECVADEILAGAGSPTVLFGHGLGALIAFETARRLKARHWPMVGLFVSGHGGPALDAAAPSLADLPIDQSVAQLRLRHALPPDLLSDPDAMRLLLPVLRADLAMMERYRYETAQPLSCPIVACDAMADPAASRGDAEGWKRETTGRFSIQRFGGDRSYIHREREALTALISNHLSVIVGALARSAAHLA
jgi:medium-chain acyl-[acyl-carrier-protein] hydrolase